MMTEDMNTSAYMLSRTERKPSLLDNLLGECARKAAKGESRYSSKPKGEWFYLNAKKLPEVAKNWLDEMAGWLLPEWIWEAEMEVFDGKEGDVLAVWDDTHFLLYDSEGKHVTDEDDLQDIEALVRKVAA